MQQPPGFLAAVSGKINCTNPVNGKSSNPPLPDWVINQPPLLQPISPSESGQKGPVPLPLSISWQRHTPVDELGKVFYLMFVINIALDNTVKLIPMEEPDVLVIILQKQAQSLLSVRFSIHL